MFQVSDKRIKELLTEVLEEVGLISPFITRTEIITQIGRHRYEKAIKSGLLYRNKANGRNASVRVKRSEYKELLNKGKI